MLYRIHIYEGGPDGLELSATEIDVDESEDAVAATEHGEANVLTDPLGEAVTGLLLEEEGLDIFTAAVWIEPLEEGE